MCRLGVGKVRVFECIPLQLKRWLGLFEVLMREAFLGCLPAGMDAARGHGYSPNASEQRWACGRRCRELLRPLAGTWLSVPSSTGSAVFLNY